MTAPNERDTADSAAPGFLPSAMEMKKAVVALGLELPESVWEDVRQRWNAVTADIKHLTSENDQLKAALVDLLDYADHHRVSSPDAHGHDCYEEWCLVRDEGWRVVNAPRFDGYRTGEASS